MVTERFYYDYVETFLRDSLSCFATGQRVGPQSVGYADVLGVRDLGGRESSDFEIVAVEVKLTTDNFAKLLGQAHGYSLFAHKTYLAVPMRRYDSFTDAQAEIANRLGVGLIEIRGRRARRCTEVLTAKYGTPMEALALKALDSLGYHRCAICRVLISEELGYTRRLDMAARSGKLLYWAKSAHDGKPLRKLLFVRGGPDAHYRYTYVCSSCLAHLTLKSGSKS